MQATVCDICKKMIDKRHWISVDVYTQSTYGIYFHRDVCRECAGPLFDKMLERE